MPTTERADPFRGFQFDVNVEGINAQFRKVSGLESEVEVTEYREGSDALTPRKLPGLVKYTNIVLERGITTNTDLVDWYNEVASITGGNPADANSITEDIRRTVTITERSRTNEETRRYTFFRAWPCKLQQGDMEAGSSDVHIETLEICHEGFTVEQVRRD